MTKISISEFYQCFFSIVKMLLNMATLKTEKEKEAEKVKIDAAIKTLRGRFDASDTNGALKSAVNYTLLTLTQLKQTADVAAFVEVLKQFESGGRESKTALKNELEELKKQLAAALAANTIQKSRLEQCAFNDCLCNEHACTTCTVQELSAGDKKSTKDGAKKSKVNK